jgi:transposase
MCVAALGAQLRMLKAQILEFDRMIRAWHRSSEASRRLDAIPGVGEALATALVAKPCGSDLSPAKGMKEARVCEWLADPCCCLFRL